MLNDVGRGGSMTRFGPVATIMAYGDLDEAVDIANDTEYGLSAVISGDPAQAAGLAPKLRAGMVAVNAWGPGPGAAFGGYKASGNGREGVLIEADESELSEAERSGEEGAPGEVHCVFLRR